jgi:prenyltransferase beta subunit
VNSFRGFLIEESCYYRGVGSRLFKCFPLNFAHEKHGYAEAKAYTKDVFHLCFPLVAMQNIAEAKAINSVHTVFTKTPSF